MRHSSSALCLATLSVLGLAATAQSADMALRPTTSQTSVVADWTGFYAGIHAGNVSSQGGVELRDHFGVLIPLDVDNGLFYEEKKKLRSTFGVGLTAGYNQQFGQFVLGIEGDITLTSLDASHHRERIDPNPIVPFFGQNVVSDYETKFEDIMTLRLRAGATFGNSLFYATAGLAAADVENAIKIAIPGLGYASPDWSKSGMAWGYAIGGGIEHKINKHVSVKAEALYVDLEDRTVKGRDPVSFPGEGLSYKFENNLTVARVGMNYSF